MLKKFMKSKVFVLSMLAVSIGNDAKGMDFIFPDENNGAFGNDFYVPDNDFLDILNDQGNNEVCGNDLYFQGDDFLGIGDNQGNDEQPQDTNAVTQASAVATPINQPIAVMNPIYYPPNWDSSGARQFFDKHPEYNVSAISLYHLYTQMRLVGLPDNLATLTSGELGNVLQVRTWFADNWDIIKDYADKAIQTNPQTQNVGQALCLEDWAGSAAEKFCIDLGLKNIVQIANFVAKARALDYAVQAVPNYAIEGRRVFMNEVYPVLATLPEEEIQEIKNYKNELLPRWKDSSIGQYCSRNKIRSKELLLKLYDFVSKKIDLPKMNRCDQRSKPLILKRILNNEQTIVPILQENPDILQQLQQNQ